MKRLAEWKTGKYQPADLMEAAKGFGRKGYTLSQLQMGSGQKPLEYERLRNYLVGRVVEMTGQPAKAVQGIMEKAMPNTDGLNGYNERMAGQHREELWDNLTRNWSSDSSSGGSSSEEGYI
ncbi:MAG: hypothetical protein K940chlam2_01091 [Chlamydiae bacterium]|nr:hypothetical protein [Chlamydiota bacterium]